MEEFYDGLISIATESGTTEATTQSVEEIVQSNANAWGDKNETVVAEQTKTVPDEIKYSNPIVGSPLNMYGLPLVEIPKTCFSIFASLIPIDQFKDEPVYHKESTLFIGSWSADDLKDLADIIEKRTRYLHPEHINDLPARTFYSNKFPAGSHIPIYEFQLHNYYYDNSSIFQKYLVTIINIERANELTLTGKLRIKDPIKIPQLLPILQKAKIDNPLSLIKTRV